EMKDLLNRVIQAQKEAEANVILRREETAATRSMAQTAKVLAENPLLVRLKELEAYKDLAAKVGQVHLVLGEGAVPTLQLKGG
ncbi:MAG: slipin family protein, partial [Verrucomicrobiaceae bacterium]